MGWAGGVLPGARATAADDVSNLAWEQASHLPPRVMVPSVVATSWLDMFGEFGMSDEETSDAVAAAAKALSLHVCLLRATDVTPRSTWVHPSQRRRVVFLHGWLQDHSSWLSTAHLVRRAYGHDCLLLDWPCHGLSETPHGHVHGDVMGPELCLAALRATLERVGWADGSVPLTLAGCSYGGAMAMRYTSCWPAEVRDACIASTTAAVALQYRLYTGASRCLGAYASVPVHLHRSTASCSSLLPASTKPHPRSSCARSPASVSTRHSRTRSGYAW